MPTVKEQPKRPNVAFDEDLVRLFSIASITNASIGSLEDDWSTAYTVEGSSIGPVLVSKSIHISKDILMNIDNRPVHLYFNRHLPKYYFSDELREQQKELTNNIHYCLNWSELSEKMQLNPKTICFHVSELENSSAVEIVNMVNTLSKLLSLSNRLTVTVGIESNTPYSVIKDLQKSNIFGIIPAVSSFPKEECFKALAAQWNNIPYWPKHILDKLPGAKKPTVKANSDKIQLTSRQQQILNLIRERGASNKIIAKTLNIAESTVKLHVGIVLKKYGVKNRTQLALFSKK